MSHFALSDRTYLIKNILTIDKGGVTMVEVATDNIAKDFKIGNTRVKIATDFCKNMSQDDVEKILERIAIKAKHSLVAAEAMVARDKETEV